MRHPKILFATLCIALAATGCGRKEPPRAVPEGGPPEIVSLAHEISGNSLKLTLRLGGGADGVGFQIDRAEYDPYCNCPAFWRRYHEQQPRADVRGERLTHLINLRSHERAYYFRVRAVDARGNLGPWSEPILARAEEMIE